MRVVSHHGYRHLKLKTEHDRVGKGTRGLEMGPRHVRKRSSQLRPLSTSCRNPPNSGHASFHAFENFNSEGASVAHIFLFYIPKLEL